ncbi:MAG: hypothetical protein H6811_01940 [Phycisphaeraceae bacterium]|nr:hypothetical protein [Phycisphaeraceae bacterium]
MGEELGAEVHLDRAPLKYAGLTSTEIWISEAQERMVLAVPRDNLEALRSICEQEQVELAVLGTFGTSERELILIDHGMEVGRLSMEFLHDGIPTPRREAGWVQGRRASAPATSGHPQHASRLSDSPQDPKLSTGSVLLALLAHPSIASKHWIIRQYDHEVQGNLITRPLVGPLGRGPGDATVLQPRPGVSRALAIACGLQTRLGDPQRGGDPYRMALSAIDECVRNLVCVGADPDRIAILDNFCWPSCAKPQNLAALVRACEGCYDGAKAYRTPFISGKDSLNNQFAIPGRDGRPDRTIEIPYTLLISGMGIVPDAHRCVTMDAKAAGHALVLIGNSPRGAMGASLAAELFPELLAKGEAIPTVDLRAGPASARAVAVLIQGGHVHAAHDVSDGGLLVAIAEMLIAGSTADDPLGATLTAGADGFETWFNESPSRYVLEMDASETDHLARVLEPDVPFHVLGRTDDSGSLAWSEAGSTQTLAVEDLARAWRSTLDW